MTAPIMPFNSYLALPEGKVIPERLNVRFPCSMKAFGLEIKHNFFDKYYIKSGKMAVEVIVLGHIYNPFSGKSAEDAVLDLVEMYSESKNGFYDIFSECSGRFVALIGSGNGMLEVLPDACASLPVNYLTFLDPHGSIKVAVSSHAYFIKEAFALPSCSDVNEISKTRFYHLGIRHCPADLTEVEGVKMLTPNLSLIHREGEIKIQRLFPRSYRSERGVKEVVGDVSRALLSSVDCLTKFRKPIHCALSGGIDSRMTLAAAVEKRDEVQFFTFAGEGNAGRDLLCTKNLSQNLSFKFNEIWLDDKCPTEEFSSLYRNLQGETRVPNVQETFARQQYFGTHDNFEVRSSISEVSRSFIKRKFHIGELALTADAMVPIYKRVPFSREWHNFIREKFEAWMESSSFREIEEYGYDWLDFYYWEVRVGTWQALVLQDADYYTNPTVIFNNRKLLGLMLSVPEKYRKDDSLHVMLMSKLDDNVLKTPIVKNFGKKAWFREALEANYLKVYQALIAD
ncbi:hypothetical protein [Litchfieldella rifensis]|uniref:Asparagine synthetase domain-containing protein n=1 Tax=Litchfieldella rifensis TaxID=762643 RepID=A0ABV7LU91_9GAMM